MWLKGNHIKAVLFDVDGTLLDTSIGITHSVRYTLEKLGLQKLSEDTLRKFVGPPPQEAFQKYVELSKEEAQRAANVYREFYKKEALFEASVYEGILSLLERLKQNGYKIGVATYKREDYALDILRHFGISPYCEVIHGADNENKLTKADIIDLCCVELGVPKSNIMLVGDTEHDAIGAYRAGVKFCAVTWGFGYKPDEVASNYPIALICNDPNSLTR